MFKKALLILSILIIVGILVWFGLDYLWKAPFRAKGWT